MIALRVLFLQAQAKPAGIPYKPRIRLKENGFACNATANQLVKTIATETRIPDTTIVTQGCLILLLSPVEYSLKAMLFRRFSSSANFDYLFTFVIIPVINYNDNISPLLYIYLNISLDLSFV